MFPLDIGIVLEERNTAESFAPEASALSAELRGRDETAYAAAGAHGQSLARDRPAARMACRSAAPSCEAIARLHAADGDDFAGIWGVQLLALVPSTTERGRQRWDDSWRPIPPGCPGLQPATTR